MYRSSVHFFDAELKNGHIMSRPKYEPDQEFIGSLVQEIEQRNPEFAWVQFLFRDNNYSSHLLRMNSYLDGFKKYAETPVTKVDSEGKEYKVERKERRREWYRSIPLKMKKIEEALPKPKLVMAVQGMWVGSEKEVMSLNAFAHCRDEIDGLAVRTLHDPRMLRALVRRNFVEDLSDHFASYGGSRKTPPSLALTTDELPYYIHLPTGAIAGSLRSLAETFGSAVDKSTTKRTPFQIGGGQIAKGEDEAETKDGFPVAALLKFPALEKKLDEASFARLKHLASSSKRTFELAYSKEAERTEILVGAEVSGDLQQYEDLLSSLYGGISFKRTDPIPAYLKTLSREVTGASKKKIQ